MVLAADRHVLMVTDATSFAGAEISLGHLVASLGPAFRVTVLGCDADVVRRVAEQRPGSRSVVLPVRDGRVAAADVLAHRRVLRGLAPDLVHVNLRHPAACRPALVAAGTLRGLPIVAVDHLPATVPTPTGRWLTRLLGRRVDAYVAVGTASAAQVEQVHGLRPGAARVVHNGVPLVPPRRPEASRGRPPVLGAVGRFEDQKGLDVLLRALVALPQVRLLLAGDGPRREALEDLAAELGVRDRVTFTGWLDDVGELLRAVDVFVLPSRHEGLPLALLEAMMSGCPVVATTVGSVRDVVVDAGTGLLVEPDDPAALAHAVDRLLEDRALARRLAGSAAAEARARLTTRHMAEQYERLYAQLWSGSAPVRSRSAALTPRWRVATSPHRR